MEGFFDKEINKAENEIKLDLKKGDLKKSRFIDEIMQGYGDEIKRGLQPVVKPKKKAGILIRIYKKIKTWMK